MAANPKHPSGPVPAQAGMTLDNMRAYLFGLLLFAGPALAAPIESNDIRVIDGDTLRARTALRGFTSHSSCSPSKQFERLGPATEISN